MQILRDYVRPRADYRRDPFKNRVETRSGNSSTCLTKCLPIRHTVALHLVVRIEAGSSDLPPACSGAHAKEVILLQLLTTFADESPRPILQRLQEPIWAKTGAASCDASVSSRGGLAIHLVRPTASWASTFSTRPTPLGSCRDIKTFRYTCTCLVFTRGASPIRKANKSIRSFQPLNQTCFMSGPRCGFAWRVLPTGSLQAKHAACL